MLTYISFKGAKQYKCYHCDNMQYPYYCDTVKLCKDNEVKVLYNA